MAIRDPETWKRTEHSPATLALNAEAANWEKADELDRDYFEWRLETATTLQEERLLAKYKLKRKQVLQMRFWRGKERFIPLQVLPVVGAQSPLQTPRKERYNGNSTHFLEALNTKIDGLDKMLSELNRNREEALTQKKSVYRPVLFTRSATTTRSHQRARRTAVRRSCVSSTGMDTGDPDQGDPPKPLRHPGYRSTETRWAA